MPYFLLKGLELPASCHAGFKDGGEVIIAVDTLISIKLPGGDKGSGNGYQKHGCHKEILDEKLPLAK